MVSNEKIRQGIKLIYERYGVAGLCILKALLMLNGYSHDKINRLAHAVCNHFGFEYSKDYIPPLLSRIADIINSVTGERLIDHTTSGRWYVAIDVDAIVKMDITVTNMLSELSKPKDVGEVRGITQELSHDEVVDMISRIGEELGYIVRKEYSKNGIYRFDVVWFKPPSEVPHKIFEVVSSGSDVDKALARLKHAYDIWRGAPDLFIVLTDEAKKQRVDKLIQIQVGGAFHEIADKFVVLTIDELLTLRKAIDVVKKLKLL